MRRSGAALVGARRAGAEQPGGHWAMIGPIDIVSVYIQNLCRSDKTSSSSLAKTCQHTIRSKIIIIVRKL
jgi:hypothetical protein